ncbi:MAG: TatD family hydrolase [Candidatus Lokiarchaeota archaeon]|nr:TatD family hydrolase [Candidatus Lokiarchaeota archaeon]
MTKKILVPEPEDGLKFIDVHCHLPFPRPKNDNRLPSDEVQLNNYFDSGGVYLITSTIDISTLNMTLKFINDKNLIGFSCGWAPQTVTYTTKQKYEIEWKKWKSYIESHQSDYLAIGEVGLDFHHAKSLEKRSKQISELEKIFEVTRDFNKPYVLHVRNAAEHEIDKENPDHRFNTNDGATKEMLHLLEKYHIRPSKVLWHCFSGPDVYGAMLPQQGFMLSVPSSAFGVNKWRRATINSPLESLLTETDSYYQHPFLRAPLNVPSNVKYSIAAIAYSHNLAQKEVSLKTVENALNFFEIER